VFVDTVQPVETETLAGGDPGVQYLANSFNINGDTFGDDCFSTACHGFVVWAYDPATKKISHALTESASYISPPNADEPSCTQCIETIDTRITGTPVYSKGADVPLISFGIGTALFSGSCGRHPLGSTPANSYCGLRNLSLVLSTGAHRLWRGPGGVLSGGHAG
jgi:hypothetical protein